ncbi:MAG TPA: hypothetical protein VNA69_08745 [Thermoanaerobaculia bacterium]|nr:hypothetical protein [Thermoanaerobaculia bacterium]
MIWQDDFAPDGALRDIAIPQVTREDWDAVLRLVETRYQPIRFKDGAAQANRIDLCRLFVGDDRPVLPFEAGGVELACHFVDEREIEFDFYPNEIRTEEQLRPLLRFVAEIGAATSKPAAITPENAHDLPIFQYSPESGVVHYVGV